MLFFVDEHPEREVNSTITKRKDMICLTILPDFQFTCYNLKTITVTILTISAAFSYVFPALLNAKDLKYWHPGIRAQWHKSIMEKGRSE